MITEDGLFELRASYADALPFSQLKVDLWAEIQRVESDMDPDVIRRVIERVIYRPVVEEVQLSLLHGGMKGEDRKVA